MKIPIASSCTIGRSKSNSLAIASDRVSRRHASIHFHEDGEYLIVDLGSSNGTFLNGIRVGHSSVLHNGDIIEIGPARLMFRTSADLEFESVATDNVASAVSHVACWLLSAATEHASGLNDEETLDDSFKTVDSWPIQCEQVISRCSGGVRRRSEHEILAYWIGETTDIGITQNVLDAFLKLKVLQKQHRDRFRIVLHHGKVLMEPSPSGLFHSLEGGAVALVLHLQRLVWFFPATSLLSKAAAAALVPLATALPLNVGENKTTSQPFYTL